MILTICGIFNIIVSVFNIISLISYYSDRLDIALHAKSMPSSIAMLIIGIILLIISYTSKRLIGDANFYSSYFENDLDGYIHYSKLAEVTGKSPNNVKKQLQFFHKIYMKNYELKTIKGTEQVVLYSKKCSCQCKSCGAPIEKRIYFTGVCPYCGSSDLYAKVLTNNRVYTITNNMSKGIKKPEYYSVKKLQAKSTLFIVLLCLGLIILLLASISCIDNISKYNDQEYLREVLFADNHLGSFKLIKAEIINNIIWDLTIIVAFIPIIFNSFKKIKYLFTAEACSTYFSNCKVPFVKPKDLPLIDTISSEKDKMKAIRGALRHGYLLNSTLENHNDEIVIALAKEIVKDRCPTCKASIVGAVDEHYKCKYCDNTIMNVIRKK